MKRIIQGLALAALVSVAPAVWSGWNLDDTDPGGTLPVHSTWADRHAAESSRLYGFPSLPNADVARNFPNMPTHADKHAGEAVQLYGFAGAVDSDAGVSLPTRSTYSDRFGTDRARVAGTER